MIAQLVDMIAIVGFSIFMAVSITILFFWLTRALKDFKLTDDEEVK